MHPQGRHMTQVRTGFRGFPAVTILPVMSLHKKLTYVCLFARHVRSVGPRVALPEDVGKRLYQPYYEAVVWILY